MSKLLDYILCLGVCCALMHPYRANANKLKYKAFKSQQRFFRETRCSTCKALFSELLLEVQRHSLHADGEEDILDSVEAACLGVVQLLSRFLARKHSPFATLRIHAGCNWKRRGHS